MQFENIANLTLANSNLLGVNATDSLNIISFVNTSTANIDGWSSTRCIAGDVLWFQNNNAYEAGSLVTVADAHFSDSSGGSIGISNHSASIRNSTFNNISGDGRLDSAIYHDNLDDARLEVLDCTFTNLVNNAYAPAIMVRRADLYLARSSFVNCTAGFAVVFIDNDELLAGGFNSNETATVESCLFENNSASNGSSVLYHLGKDQFPFQQLNVYNSMFRGNTAAMGGAVTLLAVGFAEVVGCTFEDNASIGGLGAVYNYGWPEQASAATDWPPFSPLPLFSMAIRHCISAAPPVPDQSSCSTLLQISHRWACQAAHFPALPCTCPVADIAHPPRCIVNLLRRLSCLDMYHALCCCMACWHQLCWKICNKSSAHP